MMMGLIRDRRVCGSLHPAQLSPSASMISLRYCQVIRNEAGGRGGSSSQVEHWTRSCRQENAFLGLCSGSDSLYPKVMGGALSRDADFGQFSTLYLEVSGFRTFAQLQV